MFAPAALAKRIFDVVYDEHRAVLNAIEDLELPGAAMLSQSCCTSPSRSAEDQRQGLERRPAEADADPGF